MEFAKVTVIFTLFVIVSASLVASVPVDNKVDLKEQAMARKEQEEISCMLRSVDKRREFFDAVQTKHGFSGSRVRSLLPQVFQNATFRCFSTRTCPESEVTWCFNLYHPTKCIEICWNSNGTVLNCTKDAERLGLRDVLNVTSECRLSDPGETCISLENIPFFLSGGLLTCTAESSLCTQKTFTRLGVRYVGLSANAPVIQLHNASSELVLGEQNIYLISAVYPTEPIFLNFFDNRGLQQFTNGTPVVSTIPQDGPFCEVTEGCEPAGSQFDKLRDQRIRFYTSCTTNFGCPAISRTHYSWLVIDDARASDSNMTISFSASTLVFADPFPSNPTVATSELTLDLVPVQREQGSGYGESEDLVADTIFP